MATIVQQTNGEKEIFKADEYTLVQQQLATMNNTIGTKAAQTDMTSVMSQLADIAIDVKSSKYGAKSDYDISTKTGTDNTTSFQNALNDAASLGCDVIVPAGMYLILGNLTIPDGVNLIGRSWQQESLAKTTNTIQFKGSVLVLRGAQITTGANTGVSDFTIFYDEQNYTPVADSSQLDGYSAFVSYPATFLYSKSGLHIERIVYLGGSIFMQQIHDTNVPEKIRVNEIYGMPLETGIILDYCTDSPRFTNIHWNTNSYFGIADASTYATALATKTAKNMIAFQLGRVDDILLENVIVYGCREFVYFYNSSDSRDNGQSWGMSAVGCYADGCHSAYRIDRSNGPFGLKIVNGFYTPSVYKPVIGGVVSSETPAFIRFSGGNGQFSNKVSIANAVVFSGSSSAITDSKQATTYYQFNGNTNVVKVSSSFHDITSTSIVNNNGDRSNQVLFDENVNCQYGTVTAPNQAYSASTFYTVNITFPKPYQQIPSVIADWGGFPLGANWYACDVEQITTTGATIHFASGGSGTSTPEFTWQAMGI